MSVNRRASIVLLAVFLFSTPAFSQAIQWHLTTDKSVYSLGEPVVFSIEACNTGPTATVVDLNVAPLVMDASGEAVFAFTLLPWVNDVEIPPDECRSATDQGWGQEDNMGQDVSDQVPPGWYHGDLDDFTSAPFEILQVAPVPISPFAACCFAFFVAIVGTGIVRRFST